MTEISRYLHSRRKRTVDVVGATAALSLGVPAGVAGATAIAVADKVNPLFRQQRLGRGDAYFWVYKLCTMAGVDEGLPSQGHNDARASRVGRLLRIFRIDETPQLLQIIAGQMSLVGPRPMVRSEHEIMQEVLSAQTYRALRDVLRYVRPGIMDPFNEAWIRGGCDPDEKAGLYAEHTIRYGREGSVRQDFAIMASVARLALNGFSSGPTHQEEGFEETAAGTA